jgi:predicted HTH transcriptional regulator
LVGVAVGIWLSRKRSKQKSEVKGIVKVNQEKAEVKDERKERILNFLQMRGKTNNDEVQRMLNVSDASAENYLDELEKEGKIRQVGEKGRFVEYELNG